jgi:pyruvate/2-oxoacid:ferredoxin oxidoreductase alpha subunit
MDPRKPGERLLLQGNEAIVYGALAAGCRFYAGYPITPASEIAELLSVKLPQVNGTLSRWRMKSPPWGQLSVRPLPASNR